MKKILGILILCLFPSAVSAQWLIGGKIGTNMSKLVNCPDIGEVSGSEIFDFQSKFGINIGAVANYQINDKFAVQGELLYSLSQYKDKNFTLDDNPNHFLADGLKYKRHSIDLPVLVQYYPFGHDRGFNLEAGIHTGFEVAEKAKCGDQKIDNYADSRPVNCGILVGTSYLSSNNWLIDLRYIFGLTDRYKDFDGMNLRSLQLSVGYLF